MKKPKLTAPTVEENEQIIAQYAAPYLESVLKQTGECHIRYKSVYRGNKDGVPRVILQLDITIPVKETT